MAPLNSGVARNYDQKTKKLHEDSIHEYSSLRVKDGARIKPFKGINARHLQLLVSPRDSH